MKKYCVMLMMLFNLPASIWSLADASILTFEKTLQSRLQDLILIDARNLAACQSSSVPGARCLPAQTFQSKSGELASFRDVSWAFGSANLNASDEVLVFADDSQNRDAVAGMLFLSGQQQVWRWPGTTAELQQLLGTGPGQLRGLIRSKIYSGTMRDEFIVLPDQLETLQQSGWQLMQTETGSEQQPQQPLIVATDSPLASIALFVSLLSAGHQQLKVVVDRIVIHQREFKNFAVWIGLLLISFTSLITLIIMQRYRGKR